MLSPASTVGAIFIASRVAVVVAIVIGSNIYDCMLCFVDRVELDAAVSSSRRRMAADAAQQRGGLRQAAQAADTGGRAASRAACFAVQCCFMSVSPMRARECTKMLFLGAVDACVCVACAHLLFPTLAHTWVCVVCACGTVEKSPLDPLTGVAQCVSFQSVSSGSSMAAVRGTHLNRSKTCMIAPSHAPCAASSPADLEIGLWPHSKTAGTIFGWGEEHGELGIRRTQLRRRSGVGAR